MVEAQEMTLTFTNQCNFKNLTECKIEWFKQSDDYLTLLHDHVHYLCLRLFILTRILFEDEIHLMLSSIVQNILTLTI